MAIVESALPHNPLNLKKGDEVIVHYLTFYDHSYELKPGVDIGGKKVYPISYYDVFAVVRDGELFPVGEFCLGEIVKTKVIQSSFLIIPDGVGEEEEEQISIVLHPSPNNTIGLSKGDKVVLLKWSNYKIDFNGKTYLRFRESEVIGVC